METPPSKDGPFCEICLEPLTCVGNSYVYRMKDTNPAYFICGDCLRDDVVISKLVPFVSSIYEIRPCDKDMFKAYIGLNKKPISQ